MLTQPVKAGPNWSLPEPPFPQVIGHVPCRLEGNINNADKIPCTQKTPNKCKFSWWNINAVGFLLPTPSESIQAETTTIQTLYIVLHTMFSRRR